MSLPDPKTIDDPKGYAAAKALVAGGDFQGAVLITIGRDGWARATQCERISAPGPVDRTTSSGHGAKCLAMTAPRPSVNEGSVVTSVFSMNSLVCRVFRIA